MTNELIRIHHTDYYADIPFWIRQTEGYDPILEIGCGHGRVILPLLASGHTLVGIDKDPESLSYLKGQLDEIDDKTRSRISLIQTDILDYKTTTPFGGVIIPCNTYSTFNVVDTARLIRTAYSSLREGGLFISSLPNPHSTAKFLAELQKNERSEAVELESVIVHPETGFPVQVSSRMRAGDQSLLWDWIYDHLHPDGEVERLVVTVEHFPRSQEEIVAELEQGGFGDVLCQGDFSGEEYTESSPYLILICRK